MQEVVAEIIQEPSPVKKPTALEKKKLKLELAAMEVMRKRSAAAYSGPASSPDVLQKLFEKTWWSGPVTNDIDGAELWNFRISWIASSVILDALDDFVKGGPCLQVREDVLDCLVGMVRELYLDDNQHDKVYTIIEDHCKAVEAATRRVGINAMSKANGVVNIAPSCQVWW